MLQPRLTKVEPMPQMKLQLFYETGEVKIFDVAPYATGPWYGQLQDAGYFNAVQMLPGGIGIEWPEGQDIAPHELYENSIAVIVGSFCTGTRKIQLQPWTFGTYFKFCGVAMGLWIAIIRAWNFDDDAICF